MKYSEATRAPCIHVFLYGRESLSWDQAPPYPVHFEDWFQVDAQLTRLWLRFWMTFTVPFFTCRPNKKQYLCTRSVTTSNWHRWLVEYTSVCKKNTKSHLNTWVSWFSLVIKISWFTFGKKKSNTRSKNKQTKNVYHHRCTINTQITGEKEEIKPRN